MSKFKIGDHLRVTAEGYWFDQTGAVADIQPGKPYSVFVDLDNGGQVAFRESELILADVMEDARPVNHGADCPLCAPEQLADVSKFSAFTSQETSLDFEKAIALSHAATIAANNAKFVAKVERERAGASNSLTDSVAALNALAEKFAGDYVDARDAHADAVSRPPHYTSHPSGVECIQITEHMGFNLGNAVKYVWRADLKDDAIQDLEKARWYIDRELAKRKAAL